MTRGQRKDGEHQYTISIQDELSRCIVVEVNMTSEEFAGALTSLYSSCVIAVFNDSGKVGMKREHKTELVNCSTLYGQHNPEKRMAGARALVAAHETDGWIGNVRDTENPHNQAKGSQATYAVRFERWVPAERSEHG